MADAELAAIRQELEQAKAVVAEEQKDDDLEFKYWDAEQRHEIEQERVDVQRLQVNANNQQSDDND